MIANLLISSSTLVNIFQISPLTRKLECLLSRLQWQRFLLFLSLWDCHIVGYDFYSLVSTLCRVTLLDGWRKKVIKFLLVKCSVKLKLYGSCTRDKLGTSSITVKVLMWTMTSKLSHFLWRIKLRWKWNAWRKVILPR